MLGEIALFGCVFLYLLTVGFLWSKFQSHYNKACSYKPDVSILTFLSSVFFPLALPVLMGTKISHADLSKTSRLEKRRAAEIEEAEHDIRVARLRAQENELLDRELEATKR